MFLNSHFTSSFICSLVLVLSFSHGCDKGEESEEEFVDDIMNNDDEIADFVNQIKEEQEVKYCAEALKAAGFLQDTNDTSQVLVEIFDPDEESELRSQFYQPANDTGLAVFPSQCSVKGQENDTRVFFDFSTEPDKIYLLEKVEDRVFKYKDTVCFDPIA